MNAPPPSDGTPTPAHSLAQPGPVRRQTSAQAVDQQHQLRAIHPVPRERGQQEEVEQRRHRGAHDVVRLHMAVCLWDAVDVVVDQRRVLVAVAGVAHATQEGEHEGQQGDVDAQQRHLGVEVALAVPRGLAQAEQKMGQIKFIIKLEY